jgi:hypothetical protein
MLLAIAGEEGKGAVIETLCASMNEWVHEVFEKAMCSNVVALC